MTATTTTTSLDLTDPATFVTHDPLPFWREVRRHHPVYWHPGTEGRPGFWVVAGYHDIQQIYTDADTFGSARGTVLDVLLHNDDSAGGRMLAVSDRPRHRQLRTLMQRAFSPRVLHDVAEKVRHRTVRLIEHAAQSGTLDFAADVADHIPIHTICDLLAVPEHDRRQLLEWNKQTLSAPTPDADPSVAVQARSEIVLYFIDLAEERRASPGDDVISMLATGQVGDSVLDSEDVALNCYSLILGGDESSRMSAITTVRALADNREQWHALRDGHLSSATAVAELLRWATPAMHFARTATHDATIGGQQIRAGDIVTLWNTSANNDDSVFVEPHTLTLDRNPNKHMAFGHGPHFCVGSYLGRATLHALLDALVSTVHEIELAGDPVRIYSNFLYGYRSLPVRLHPAA
ncbi:cytochrome P450 [Nocardia sp. NPDC005998]|uniref:cytochrome P450 n=1 Tax=Nocardia sp. NPDC005998 TaxID=3156894 RepID=UPI00339E5214